MIFGLDTVCTHVSHAHEPSGRVAFEAKRLEVSLMEVYHAALFTCFHLRRVLRQNSTRAVEL